MPKQCCINTWLKVGEDEPVFILRGNDALAPATIQAWLDLAEDSDVNAEKVNFAEKHLQDIKEYQEKNPDKVKLPD